MSHQTEIQGNQQYFRLTKGFLQLSTVHYRFRDHCKGITKDDYLKLFHLLNNINDVDTALTFYHIAGASIDQPTLIHVARTVAHVELDSHVPNVVLTIFD